MNTNVQEPLDLFSMFMEDNNDPMPPQNQDTVLPPNTGSDLLSMLLQDEPAVPPSNVNMPPTKPGNMNALFSDEENAAMKPYPIQAFHSNGDTSDPASDSNSSSSPTKSDDKLSTKATSPDKKARRRAQITNGVRRYRARKKRERHELEQEVNTLSKDLEALRETRKQSRTSEGEARWEEEAKLQERRRLQVMEESKQLKMGLFHQSMFLSNLRSMFINIPWENFGLSPYRLLHTATYLSTSDTQRSREIQNLCADEKLDMAVQYLQSVSQPTPVDEPVFWAQSLDESIRTKERLLSGFSSHAIYPLCTSDVSKALKVALPAFLDGSLETPNYNLTRNKTRMMDTDEFARVSYGHLQLKYQRTETEEDVDIESRVVCYYRTTPTCAVIGWDFVEQDDLQPLRPTTKAKRNVLGAAMLRLETCDDGIDRVVCRVVCTKMVESVKDEATNSARAFAMSLDNNRSFCTRLLYAKMQDDVIAQA